MLLVSITFCLMDCYKVLRVNPGASSDEIIKAANKMLSIWNPNDYDEFRDVALCVVDDIVRARRILWIRNDGSSTTSKEMSRFLS
ncbi:hypothetical protein CEXT_63041 [Caerostris extrusa]|uniref:J domain-containing protein n=1 Tax=Caerostris extrusa TaxID=172846 RepID=A0AAV4PMY9_CAEEX|nr:hypothetical protein CEXT_63041 [Caerostris extrusa]